MAGETVVLVHGLWMNGMDMSLLRWRLARAGYNVSRFSYSTLNQAPPEAARELQQFLQTLPAETLHFVCHSLGGLVVRHLFQAFPDQRPGRVVTLGTPHQSSVAAKQLAHSRAGRKLLGKSVDRGLLGGLPPWPEGRELGSIAGKLRFGLGMFIPGIPRPNDGTVAVTETRLAGMRDHIVVNASHFGLLFSREAELYIERFLKTGTFSQG